MGRAATRTVVISPDAAASVGAVVGCAAESVQPARARAAAARMPKPASLFFIEEASHDGYGQEPRRMPSAAGGGPARRRGDDLMVGGGERECQYFLDDRHGTVEYRHHPLNGMAAPRTAAGAARWRLRRLDLDYLLPLPMWIGILNPPAAQRRPHEERTSISGTHDSRPEQAGGTRTGPRLLARDDRKRRPRSRRGQARDPARHEDQRDLPRQRRPRDAGRGRQGRQGPRVRPGSPHLRAAPVEPGAA